jgi:hypothetical protein
MWRLAGLAIVLVSATASGAGAQALATNSASTTPSPSALTAAAFAPKTGPSDAEPIAALLNREAYAPGLGPVRWASGQVQLPNTGDAGSVDSLRVSVGGDLRSPGGLPLNPSRAQFESRAYEVSLIRDWPAAMRFDAKAFNVDLTPHAGVGVSNLGGSAEAGATVRISRDAQAAERLRDLGVGDGASFGDRGRWYLFAAASGRAVGLNMLHGDSGWNRAGWTTDATSSLVGDAQLGVGWRKGPMQTSFGYIHREVKGQHMIWGQETKQDSLLAFSLSIKPHP